MKPGFWDYVKSAFNARPIGMFIPPNWIGLGIFAVLGALNPGFWIIGAGLELGYLALLATETRFQRFVSGERLLRTQRQWQTKMDQLVAQLGQGDQARYRALESRCRSVLGQQLQGAALLPDLDVQAEGLGRLSWMYLRLLLTRQSIDRIIRESTAVTLDGERLEERIDRLQGRLKEESLSDELRRSLAGQVEILQQRLERRREAREKLAFLDAELARIQEQVELLREQAVLSTDPETVSERIDQITTTLGGTTEWIRQQQKIYGVMEDLLVEPPPLSVRTVAKENQ